MLLNVYKEVSLLMKYMKIQPHSPFAKEMPNIQGESDLNLRKKNATK